MENNSGTTNIVGEPTAFGVSAQPIQQRGDHLYLARYRPYSGSSLMIPFQIDTRKTSWGLTMGSKILATGGTGNVVVAVNEDGHIYQMTESEFTPRCQPPASKPAPAKP